MTEKPNSCNFLTKEICTLIKNKKITIIGCGGTGSNLCNLLARGGFENLTIIDFDIVEKSNLNRQLYTEKDIGKPKTQQLTKILKKISKNLNIKKINEKLIETNATKLLKSSEIIIDATDNFSTRKIINKYCEENYKDWLYTGAIRGESVVCMFLGHQKKFLKIFPNEVQDEKCSTEGILPSTVQITASLAYVEILEYLTNKNYEPELIKYNAIDKKYHKIKTN